MSFKLCVVQSLYLGYLRFLGAKRLNKLKAAQQILCPIGGTTNIEKYRY